MNYKHGYFSSTITTNGLIVAGGEPIFQDSALTKVEQLHSKNGSWIMKNRLPKENVGGCMSTINETTVLLIGGSDLDPSIVSIVALMT